MNLNNTFSLSLQKQIDRQKVAIDSELNRAFNELNFRSLLNRSGITKKKGYATVTLLFLVVLLPFLKRKLSDSWNVTYLQNQTDAQKDAYYSMFKFFCNLLKLHDATKSGRFIHAQ